METYTFEDYYLRLTLYKPINIADNQYKIAEFFSNATDFQFDCFCPQCSKEVTFVMGENEFYYQQRIPIGSTIQGIPLVNHVDRINKIGVPKTQVFHCQRNNEHVFAFNFLFINNQLIKTGQYPSIADIDIPGIQKYKKLLKKDYNDFSRAIGLHSHGVGAGSFVYLRRIFENLIEEKHQEVLHNEKWDEEEYKKSKMDEKIKLLREKLPEILVENRSIYGIMSKGIHELSEDECKGLFPDVKLGIELILDEKLHQLEIESKRKAFSNFVAATTADLKS